MQVGAGYQLGACIGRPLPGASVYLCGLRVGPGQDSSYRQVGQSEHAPPPEGEGVLSPPWCVASGVPGNLDMPNIFGGREHRVPNFQRAMAKPAHMGSWFQHQARAGPPLILGGQQRPGSPAHIVGAALSAKGPSLNKLRVGRRLPPRICEWEGCPCSGHATTDTPRAARETKQNKTGKSVFVAPFCLSQAAAGNPRGTAAGGAPAAAQGHSMQTMACL